MITLEVAKPQLKGALERLVRCVPKGAEGEDAAIHLAAYKGMLILSAGDPQACGMEITLPAEVAQVGLAVVPARDFLEAVKLGEKTVPIQIEGSAATIGTAAVAVLSPRAFRPQPAPLDDHPDAPARSMPTGDLKAALKDVSCAVAPPWDPRPLWRSVTIDLNQDRPVLAAANQWHLAVVTLPPADGEWWESFSISSEAATILQRSMPERSEVVLHPVGPYLCCSWWDGKLAAHLVTPRNARVISRAQMTQFQSRHHAEVERSGLLLLAKAAKDASKSTWHGIRLATSQGQLTVSTVDKDEKLICRTTGEPMARAVHAGLLADALSAVDASIVTLGFPARGIQVLTDRSVHTIAAIRETGHDTDGTSTIGPD